MFRYPRFFPRGKRVRQVVELVDVPSTLLDVLGAPPLPGAEGVSLVSTVFGRPPRGAGYAVSEFGRHARAVRLGSFKLVLSSRGPDRLYDLSADPKERSNIIASRPIARRACEVVLGEALGTPRKTARLSGAAPGATRYWARDAAIDPKLEKKLRALGYIH